MQNLNKIYIIMWQKQIQKNTAGVDTSKFAKKVDLSILKSEIDKLDIDKLKSTPVDIIKLNDVKNEVFKKTIR